MNYVIGTRGSKLAVAQANVVCSRLTKAYPDDRFEIQVVKTTGDLILDKPLSEIGEKGVFVKEIEEKLLRHHIDIGVHSMKDMPSFPAPGLMFSGAWEREDPRDVLILREKHALEELPAGAVIGTGSKRREFQLKRFRPDIQVVNIRGNVETRLKKMEEEKLDGIILAAAGLNRLGLQDKITCYLEEEKMIPAPAQGILALEIRKEDKKLLEMLNAFGDEETMKAVEGERGFLQCIGGNCHMPVGALCKKEGDGHYQLYAMFGNETGSKLAYTVVRGTEPSQMAKEAAFQIRRQMAGCVFLVGGGPGDVELITVKGLRAIREADCIVYDRLSAPELLEEAKPGCEKIYVGKSSCHHTLEQEEINRLLVKKSMEYERVVRLKGGDVYVFGRGGEEGLFLQENGVPFEVIPGISSATAGPACAGIPITHRGLASGFHVVTAHDKNQKLSEIDFKAMAGSKETGVFLMGLSKVKEIAEKLMEAGMAPGTRAAAISCATTPNQRTCVSDLEHLADDVKKANLVSPALIVVGEVVGLRDQLNFFEKKPLFGKRYLIPKIGEASTRLKELLQSQGAAVDEVLVGRIANTGIRFQPNDFKTVDWLVFTSKNGVEEFFQCFAESRLDVRGLAGCRIAAVGEKTAEVLRCHGLYADLLPKHFHSDALGETLKKYLKGREKVWHIKPKTADGHLKKVLEGFCTVEEILVYENQAVSLDLDNLRPLSEYDGILFTCASSAERLLDALGKKGEQWGRTYSIGPKTTACLRRYGVDNILEAKKQSYEGLAELCIRMEKVNIVYASMNK